MLSTTKAILNACNKYKFLKNINHVKLQKEDLSNEDFNVATYVKGSSVKMRKYKEKDSISNLSVFFSNYWGVRAFRFAFVTLPSFLIVGTGLSWLSPSKTEEKEVVPKYTCEKTVYDSEKGVNVSNLEFYDFELLDGCEIISPENITITSSMRDRIEVKLYDDYTCVDMDVSITDQNSFLFNACSVVDNYFEFTTEDLVYSENFDEEYFTKIFDKVVNYVCEVNYKEFKTTDKETLKSILASEKKNIIMSIYRFDDPTDAEIVVSKELMTRRVLFSLFTCLYLVIAIKFYYLRKDKFLVNEYKVKDGELIFDYGRVPENLFYEAIRLKSIYQRAEIERILHFMNEIEENVAPDDRSLLLNNYEKKLIKKYESKIDISEN
ncbi:MAG: hypothetical protein HFI73_01760 [Bacilli bacterium]|jgi:hypothetical protein|nr:hypothetical protein [Bacilli bacterium]